jgi:hypothetical protein
MTMEWRYSTVEMPMQCRSLDNRLDDHLYPVNRIADVA